MEGRGLGLRGGGYKGGGGEIQSYIQIPYMLDHEATINFESGFYYTEV